MIPESTKNGVPLFYIPPGSTTPVRSSSACDHVRRTALNTSVATVRDSKHVPVLPVFGPNRQSVEATVSFQINAVQTELRVKQCFQLAQRLLSDVRSFVATSRPSADHLLPPRSFRCSTMAPKTRRSPSLLPTGNPSSPWMLISGRGGCTCIASL